MPPPSAQESADQDALLERLEANVPEEFAELAAQDGFASLVEGLGSAVDWPKLRHQLTTGHPPVVPGDPVVAVELEPEEVIPEGVLAGASVLWVDNDPKNNRPYAQQLEYGGATVLLALDTEQARTVLDHGDVDVLISDIGRPERPEAGFEDLREWRDANLAPDAAFFFTSRVTRVRREAAAALRAEVMSDPRALLWRVRLTIEVSDPAARDVLVALVDSKWEFRTAEGIAKQTSVPVDRVQAVLGEYPTFVRQSPVPDRTGTPLFAARSAVRHHAPTGA